MLQDGERHKVYSRDELADRNANKHWLEKALESIIGSVVWMAIMVGCILMILFSIVSCASSLQ